MTDEDPYGYIAWLEAEVKRLRGEAGLALREATRLLESFVSEHFPPNPDWKPLPDLIGVLSQLSNAGTIARDYKTEIERLRAERIAIKAEARDERIAAALLRDEIERLKAALRECADAVAPANADFATIKARARAVLEGKP